jgi:riboflavin kinase / FMN adenylyltransferase
MKSLVGVDALAPSEGGAAVTIGTFDGVHVGHRALIQKTKNEAAARGCASAVVTWDRHPAQTLRPDHAPPLLTSPERRYELIEETGVDLLVVLTFDDEMSQWPPDRFAKRVLVEGLGARAVFVGEGWRFGHRAAGDVALLRSIGETEGFNAEGVGLTVVSGEPVSSSRIRGLVASGDVAEARTLLGRPFDIDGVVERGDRRGTTLGFPTANIALQRGLAQPKRGVYACRARAGADWYKAAVNVGVNPTFGGDPSVTPMQVEAFLLGFSGDLYGQPIRVEFHERLREELRYEGVDELVVQMGKDVEDTEKLID